MIEAVLFDLDGTLFDRDTSVRRLVEIQHDTFSFSLGHVPKPTFVMQFMKRDARGYVKKDEVYRELLQEFAISGLEVIELFDYFLAHYHDHCVPFPGLGEMLEQLHAQGLRLGIVTNGGEQFQMRTIQALGIGSYFFATLISDTEGIRKPDPAIFQRAVSRLGVTAAETVFVGDHPIVDIEGAQKAGLKAIWKRDDFWLEPTEADGVINDLRELPDLIHKLGSKG